MFWKNSLGLDRLHMEVEGMERPPSSQSQMPHIEGMSSN